MMAERAPLVRSVGNANGLSGGRDRAPRPSDSPGAQPQLRSCFDSGNERMRLPVAATALRAAELIGNSTLKVYPGAPHGLTATHKGRLNEDILGFIQPARGRLVA